MAQGRARRGPWCWIRRIALGALVVVVVLALVYVALPKGPRDPMPFTSTKGVSRDLAVGTEQAVVAGTPWAAEAMQETLDAGGNAADAAVAGLLALNVTFGEAASFPSVAPLLYRDGDTGAVASYVGAGTAPAAATLEVFRERGWDVVPEMDIWAQLLPASPDVAIALLQEHGSMGFAEVAAPAIRMAREGFPIHDVMAYNLDFSPIERAGFRILMPENARVFTQGQWWRPLHVGDRMRRPMLADTFERLADDERRRLDDGGDRVAGLQAVRDAVYEGWVAAAIVDLHDDEGGLFTAEDLAEYTGDWELPLEADFRGHRVLTNRTWSQGIAVPMILNLLEGTDLDAMTWGSVEHVHTVLQAIDLVMADREAYVGDEAFVDVPLERLLSDEYAEDRRAQLSDEAFTQMPPAGGDAPQTMAAARVGVHGRHPLAGKDTTHLAVVDRDGNAATLTPSDFPMTPMVPDTGLNLGNRMTQFRLDPEHPARLKPGKRPRITPHAVMVEEAGGGLIAMGTPGGDVQAQTNVQVLLNLLVFGLDLQEAVEAPRFRSLNFPSSFSPHEIEPGTVELEGPLYDDLADDLEARGWTVRRLERWDHALGGVGAVRLRPDGTVEAAADPHENTTALVR